MDYLKLLEIMRKAIRWSRSKGHNINADILTDAVTAIETLKTDLARAEKLCQDQAQTIRDLRRDLGIIEEGSYG